jgi:hygromycin-B 7''-O-kinase
MKIPLLNDFERTFNDPLWLDIAENIISRHKIGYGHLERAEHGENIVVLVDDSAVVKIYTPKKNGYNRERAALEFASGRTSLPFPALLGQGDIEGFQYIITTRMPGRLMTRNEWVGLDCHAQIGLLTQLAYGLKELHSENPSDIHFNWQEFMRVQMDSVMERQTHAGGNPEWLASLPLYLEQNFSTLPLRPHDAFMHGDVHFGNLRVTGDGERPMISGIFDMADSLKGFYEYEFVAIGVLMVQGQGELQREFFRAYGYLDADINDELRTRMMMLTILYEESSLRRYAERLRPEALDYSLAELERAIWNFA